MTMQGFTAAIVILQEVAAHTVMRMMVLLTHVYYSIIVELYTVINLCLV